MPPVESILVETLDPEGPYGAKECGQGPLLPIPPAVANAVYDAVGVRVDEVPISPPRVLRALRSGTRRSGPEHAPRVPWPEPIRVPTPWDGGDGRAAGEERGSRGARAAGAVRAAVATPPAIENVPGAER
jgi:hypothetical protein